MVEIGASSSPRGAFQRRRRYEVAGQKRRPDLPDPVSALGLGKDGGEYGLSIPPQTYA